MTSQVIIDAIRACEPLVRRFRESADMELEGRLGCITENGRFQPGVTRAKFRELLAKMYEFDGWTNSAEVGKWHDSVDYFSDSLRATVRPDGDWTCVRKTPVDRVNITCPERVYDVRVSLKRESIVPPPTVMNDVHLVRIKRRCQFVYEKSFSFDFTITCESNVSKFHATQQPCRYEVEVELIHNPVYMTTHNDLNISASLLEKMVDHLGRERSYSMVVVD